METVKHSVWWKTCALKHPVWSETILSLVWWKKNLPDHICACEHPTLIMLMIRTFVWGPDKLCLLFSNRSAPVNDTARKKCNCKCSVHLSRKEKGCGQVLAYNITMLPYLYNIFHYSYLRLWQPDSTIREGFDSSE